MGAGAEKYSRTYFIYDSTDSGVGICKFEVDVFMEVDIKIGLLLLAYCLMNLARVRKMLLSCGIIKIGVE